MATATVTDEAREALAATPTRELLVKAYRLTHLMHEAERAPVTMAREGVYADDLRAARDLIDAEVLLRTGGA